ncbi:MAG: TetR/AcrR family transcriptional regulator C-terminal domain-containing protein [Erysipelotrichaceae bacterium]|nr:TetR/AcrR family transcriptional regulator C-terminal domain-containing protein [Erysipelotrichaceae bacterium]
MTTKQLIKDTFKKLVVEKKTIKISIKEIVEHANVSRRTFYNYYKDRQSITEDIYIDTIETTIKECFNQKLTTELFIVEVYKTFLANKSFFLIAIQDEEQNSLFDTIIDRCQLVYSHVFGDYITDKKRLQYLSYKYASTQVMLIKKWIKEGMKETPEFMTEIYLDSHLMYEEKHDQIINKRIDW